MTKTTLTVTAVQASVSDPLNDALITEELFNRLLRKLCRLQRVGSSLRCRLWLNLNKSEKRKSLIFKQMFGG